MGYSLLAPVTGTYDEQTKEMLEWMKSNCPSYITNEVVMHENKWHYKFYFYEEKDYIWAKLKWAN